MVWWIVPNASNFSNFAGKEIREDKIFQTVNIMFSFSHKLYDAYDLNSLIAAGVNIFNIDSAIHDEAFFRQVKSNILQANNLPQICKSPYYRPTGLAVTIEIDQIMDIDDSIDFIILKGITKKEELIKYRHSNNAISSKQLFVVLSYMLEDINEIIRFSDGIILALDNVCNNMINEYNTHVLAKCKKVNKSVFIYNPITVDDFKQRVFDRHTLIVASETAKQRVDGVVLVDSVQFNMPPSKAINTFVEAISIAEEDGDLRRDYYSLSLKVKTPVLVPISVAFAASSAALTNGASAILVLTASGTSARWIAFASPPCHVIAITIRRATARLLHAYRKVIPLFYDQNRASNWQEEYWNRVHFGTTFALKIGLFCSGAKLVVLAPSEEGAGYCDAFQIVSVPFMCSV